MSRTEGPSPPDELLEPALGKNWDDASVPLQDRGVRLSWLQDLIHSITWYANAPRREALVAAEQAEYQRRASTWRDDVPWQDPVHVPEEIAYKTRDFVRDYVCPLTAAEAAPLYAFVPDHARGKPSVFVSHAWDSFLYVEGHKFGVIDAIDNHGIAGIKDEFVWIDIVCHNQHSDMQVAHDMETVIAAVGKIAFPITPIPLFDRIWCLWELLCASRVGTKGMQFCAAPGFRTDKRFMVNDFVASFTSVQHARATLADDHDLILQAIIAHWGSVDAADNYIRDLLNKGLSDTWFEKYK